jgi:hypothetical protein
MGHEHDLLFSHERGGTGAHGGGRDQRGRTLMHVRRRKRLVHIAMKVLLLGTTGTEPSFQTWQLSLNQVGVPVDAIALRGRGHVADPLGGRWAAALPGRDSVDRRALRRGAEPGAPPELEALECQFGIRRLTAHVVPGCRPRPAHGTHTGRLDHVNAALIPSGRTVSAAGYQSIPAAGVTSPLQSARSTSKPSSPPRTGRRW